MNRKSHPYRNETRVGKNEFRGELAGVGAMRCSAASKRKPLDAGVSNGCRQLLNLSGRTDFAYSSASPTILKTANCGRIELNSPENP